MKTNLIKKIKNKYVISAGISFICLVLLICIFLFSRSYALQGFGQMNLSCDKTITIAGEIINCTVTGTVDDSSQVSSLSSKLKLSDNLELVNIKTDSSWQGDGENGDIKLYTDENKSSTFPIANFTVKIKDGVTNADETITLENNYFYDENFQEQAIENTSFNIKTPQYHSSVYDLSKDYIITTTKDIETILSNIETDGCTKSISSKQTGTITNTSKLIIMYNSSTVKEYNIVYVGSTKYDLTKDYILTSLKDINEIKNNLELINATATITNNELAIQYQGTTVKTYKIINITSNDYYIDIKNGFLVTNHTIDTTILDSINCSEGVTTNLSLASNTVEIIYQTKTIKTLKIIYLTSEQYQIQPGKGYIYTNTATMDNNNITTNATLEKKENSIEIKSDNKLITSLEIITIQSNTYQINPEKHFIYTKNITDLQEITKNINVTAGSITKKENNFEISYQDYIVDTFEHCYFDTNYPVKGGKISIQGDLRYETFISEIRTNGISFKVQNQSDVDINVGTVTSNYTVKFYYENTLLLDTYTIQTEFLELTNLKVKEDSKIIYQVKLKTTYQSLLENISTSGTIEIKDDEGTKVELDDYVKTSDNINIHLSDETITYKVSVLGDITGNAAVTIGDVARVYQYIRQSNPNWMEEEYILAADVNYNNKVDVGDVGRLYQFLRNKIDTLDKPGT